jgi:hypothetical protein
MFKNLSLVFAFSFALAACVTKETTYDLRKKHQAEETKAKEAAGGGGGGAASAASQEDSLSATSPREDVFKEIAQQINIKIVPEGLGKDVIANNIIAEFRRKFPDADGLSVSDVRQKLEQLSDEIWGERRQIEFSVFTEKLNAL